jgi:hypothetical protein
MWAIAILISPILYSSDYPGVLPQTTPSTGLAKAERVTVNTESITNIG